MANKTICIEREYGSNGMKIAQWLSKSTGMTVYGRDALQAIAKENDLVKEISEEDPDWEKEAYKEAVNFLSARENCIFVGTGAASVCQGKERNLNIFIKADEESKIAWVMASGKIGREAAVAKIEEMGTHRENNRKNFAVTETGEPVVYDLVLSSSKFGIEGSAEIIKQSVSRI